MMKSLVRSKDREWSITHYPKKLHPIIGSPYPAPSEYWTFHEGEAVATVGAVVSSTAPERGYIGFFELLHGASEELGVAALQAARNWLKEKGCTRAYGPINLSTWFTYRYKLPSPDPYQFWFEPIAPDSYRSCFTKADFVDDSLFLSEAIETYATLEAYAKPAYEKAIASGYRIEGVDTARFVKELLPRLYPICMKSFAKNYLFEPISLEGFLALYSGISSIVDLKHSQLLYSPEGELIGFSLWIVENRHIMMKTVAVDPAYQGRGLSNAMVWPAIQSGKLEADRFAGVMFKADNISASYSKHGKLFWRHEYMLYRSDL
jgi:GNAT superfamily N-acetyltransferase